MKITAEQWAKLRQAVTADDQELFERLVTEWARVAVAGQRVRQRTIDQVRSSERGTQPYFCFQR